MYIIYSHTLPCTQVANDPSHSDTLVLDSNHCQSDVVPLATHKTNGEDQEEQSLQEEQGLQEEQSLQEEHGLLEEHGLQEEHGIQEEQSLQEEHDLQEDELFMSASNKLLTNVSSSTASCTDTYISTKSGMTLSEVTDDPLSMMEIENTSYLDTEVIKVTDPNPIDSSSLLPINEDYYSNNYSLDQIPKHLPDSIMSFNSVIHSTNINPLPPTNINPLPPNKSPLSSPRFTPKPKMSPRTQMRLNRSGKQVPIIPPRPIATKRTVSVPDPDTVSLLSNVSSISAYSADEIYDHNHNSVLSSSTTSSLYSHKSGHSAAGTYYQPLEHIIESPHVNEDVPSHQSHQAADNDYTIIILSLAWILLYLYYSLNPFVYLAGFLAGFLVFYCTIGSAFYWYVQHSEREKERRNAATRRVELPTIEELPKTINTDFESSRNLEVSKMYNLVQWNPSLYNRHHWDQQTCPFIRGVLY